MPRKPPGDDRLPLLPPWYSDGLRFECQPDCGACCTNHGNSTHVYLESGDEQALAQFLELDRRTFRRRYTTLDDGYRVLRMDTPECPFLDGTRCGVYAARPAQCRTFPFWKENLATPRQWKKLCGFCPGIDRGRNHVPAEIRRRLRDG